MTLTFILTSAPDAAEIEALEGALTGYFTGLGADAKEQSLAVLARDGQGAVVAGLAAKTGWDQLYIRTLYVADHLRGQGIGQRLIGDVEAEGRRRGCVVSWLMCSSAEAKRFYERCGYTCLGEAERRPPNPPRWFMKKAL